MARVTELGYMGFSVRDAEAWKRYAGEIVGMEVSEEGEADRFYLRMDNWHHRIVVHTNGDDDLAYVGWRVAGPDEFDEMASQLKQAGIVSRVASKEEAAERRVLGLIKLADPSGNPTEIFYGPQVDTHRPFHPGRPMHGRFSTGAGGMGHCILRQKDMDAGYRFYHLLGLRGSVEYHLPTPDGKVTKPIFMHCNERQHSLAFGDFGPAPKRINHLMVEYTELDDLGIAHDLIRRRKFDVILQLGKHANDQMYSFYCANPSGWVWEIGWGSRKALAQQEYYTTDTFGHALEVTKGYGLDVDVGPR